MTLSDLPEELVSNVAARLGSDDAFALRLSCKALETKTFHEFATEYFTEKAVHFTTDSLQVLLEISRNTRLRKYLKEVYVVPAAFSVEAFSSHRGACCSWTPSVKQAEAYRTYVLDQRKLKDAGGDRMFLAKIFSNLGSLRVVALVDSIGLIKASTDYRGSQKVPRTTGNRQFTTAPHTFSPKAYQAWLSHVFSTLMRAVAVSGVPVHDFKTEFKNSRDGINLKQMSFAYETYQKLLHTFQNTSHLHLRLNDDRAALIEPRDALPACHFSSLFPNLTDLSLSFIFGPQTGILCATFLCKIPLGKLKTLQLDNAIVSDALLARTISEAANLTELKLERVNLVKGTWPDILEAIMELEHLSHLHLMYLREGGCKAFFLTQLDVEPEDDGLVEDVDDWIDDEAGSQADEELSVTTSDPSMPDLEPVTGSASATATDLKAQTTMMPNNQPNDQPTTTLISQPTNTPDETLVEMLIFTPHGAEDMDELGSEICLDSRWLILKCLPAFIKKYNVGAVVEDGISDFPMDPLFPIPLPGDGAAGHGFDAFMVELKAAMGAVI